MTIAPGISLFAMMLMMTIHVIGRKLAMPVPGAFEASEQLMVVVVSFPPAEVSPKKGKIIFELVSRKFAPGLKRRMDIIGNLVGLFLFAPLTYQALGRRLEVGLWELRNAPIFLSTFQPLMLSLGKGVILMLCR